MISNPLPSANSRRPFRSRWPWKFGCSLASAELGSPAAVAEGGRYRDMKLHSILLGRSNPDQALRVAAGILGKRASGGRWPSGHYCQGCEAFPTMHRTWKPQSGVELELGDMVKTN